MLFTFYFTCHSVWSSFFCFIDCRFLLLLVFCLVSVMCFFVPRHFRIEEQDCSFITIMLPLQPRMCLLTVYFHSVDSTILSVVFCCLFVMSTAVSSSDIKKHQQESVDEPLS